MTRVLNALKLVALAAPPANPQEGWAYLDTTLSKAGFYVNGAWVYAPGGSGGIPAGAALIQDSSGSLAVNATDAETSNIPTDASLFDLLDSETETIAAQVDAIFLEIAANEFNNIPTEQLGDLELTGFVEINSILTETSAIDLAATEANNVPTETVDLALNIPDETNTIPTDIVGNLDLVATEANNAPTEIAGNLEATQIDETNPIPTETSELTNVNDEFNPIPTEVRTSTLNVWLSGCTQTSANGTVAPANADGSNDGVFATVKTVALGATTATITSAAMGSTKLPTGTPFTAAIARPYFRVTSPTIGSTWAINATWTGGSATIDSIPQEDAQNTVRDHSTGNYTFDLFASGMNTVAKAQSLVITMTTTDSASGVGVKLEVDAISIEIPNIV